MLALHSPRAEQPKARGPASYFEAPKSKTNALLTSLVFGALLYARLFSFHKPSYLVGVEISGT